MTIKAVLFDVDGTLLDTTEFIVQAVLYILKTYKLPPKTRDEIIKAIGLPILEFYQLLTGQQDVKEYAEVHHEYQKKLFYLSKPFENVADTLIKLKEHKLQIAAVTSRERGSVITTLELAYISHLFDYLVTSTDVTNLKPHPEPVLKALNHFHVQAQEAVMIGDTEHDIKAGKAAGTQTIGVTYGFGHEKIRESNPDYVVDDIKDILDIIL
jgi:pyrophosphatase PpaX